MKRTQALSYIWTTPKSTSSTQPLKLTASSPLRIPRVGPDEFPLGRGHYITNPNNAAMHYSWEIPQNYHTFALFDAPQIGNLMGQCSAAFAVSFRERVSPTRLEDGMYHLPESVDASKKSNHLLEDVCKYTYKYQTRM